MFLFIASFSIVAGVMLLVNVFVMLADERRGSSACCARSGRAGG
jgi:hypothetical protein